ncbi:MAG: glycosyltransferase family 4 protein [candidate division WOR-3 bacterium]
MNVVFAADYIAPSPGAFIASLKYLGKHLVNEGNRVAFLFSEPRSYLKQLRRYGPVYLCKKTANRKFSMDALMKMKQAVMEIRADIVHIQFVGLAYLLAAIILKPFFRYRLIVHWRCIPEGAIRNDLYHNFTPFLYKIFSAIFIDAHIAISETIKEILIRKNFASPAQVQVIYNGVDPAEFSNSNEGKAQVLIEQLTGKRLSSRFVVGMIADYSVEKDHETFIKAADSVRKKHPNAIFLIIGSERKYFGIGMKERLVKMIESCDLQENVILLDNLPYATRVIPSFDVGVLCSHYEGFGNVLVEYMMAGKPVIGTHAGGIAEIIEDGVTGFLIAPRDYEGLAEKIIYLLGDSELRERMGKNAQRVAEARFSLSQWAEKIRALYRSLLI